MAAVSVHGLRKNYGDLEAVKGISFDVAAVCGEKVKYYSGVV